MPPPQQRGIRNTAPGSTGGMAINQNMIIKKIQSMLARINESDRMQIREQFVEAFVRANTMNKANLLEY